MTPHPDSRGIADPTSTAPEESLEDLYEHAPCGYLTSTLDGTVLRANSTFCNLIGRERGDVLGASLESMLTVGSRLFYQTRYLPTLRLNGEVREAVLELERGDGGTLPSLVTSMVVEPSVGAAFVRTAVFDATGRRDYERELLESRRAAERSEARVRVLQAASASFGAAATEESLASALVGAARDAFDAGSAAVLLATGSAPLQVKAGTRALGPTVARIAAEPEPEVMRSAEAVTVSNLEDAERQFPGLAERMRAARLESLSAVPLLVDEVPAGVLACYFGRQRTLDEDALELQESLARLAAQVLQRIRLQAELTRMALHDQLTGLANRSMLQTRLVQVLASAERYGRPMAVVFLDLDGFKRINDKLGHGIGDVALRDVAHALQRVVRVSDTLARFGGDEFVVVCEDAGESDARTVAERVRQAVELPLHGVPSAFTLTASIGIAVHNPRAGRAISAEKLLTAADEAQYESKRAGKNRVTVVSV
ncbi:diguanylate cyclase [Lysobacter korlensis]|uniref:Diguanylate cyclase n=1 Tax=Lysobacter korlensis TaxID=553636 RepID=A0ABV6S0N5_9GAMM